MTTIIAPELYMLVFPTLPRIGAGMPDLFYRRAPN